VLVREARRWPVPRSLARELRGQRIEQVRRRAKYPVLDTARRAVILHLGMSGSLRIVTSDTPPRTHDHVDIHFESGPVLRFNDPRRFGTLLWTRGDPLRHRLLAELGPEPLEDDFDGAYLHTASRGRRAAIKTFLMDGHIVVGVGNIYANEALHLAGIRPTREAGRVARSGYDALARSVKQVLNHAIERGGTTLRDFLRTDGEPGYFSWSCSRHEREGMAGGAAARIRRVVIGQRSATTVRGDERRTRAPAYRGSGFQTSDYRSASSIPVSADSRCCARSTACCRRGGATGDTARVPYGTKSGDSVVRYALQAADLLVARGIKLLVVACNTASAVALDALREHLRPLPVLGVIEPGASAAVGASSNGHFLVLATEATVHRRAYSQALHRLRADAVVEELACSLFVALAEEGWTTARSPTPLPRPISAARGSIRAERDRIAPSRLHAFSAAATHPPRDHEQIAIVDSATTTAKAAGRADRRILSARERRRALHRNGWPPFRARRHRVPGTTHAAARVELVDV
jgi:formamidopyrimidine-DNA glycosylase